MNDFIADCSQLKLDIRTKMIEVVSKFRQDLDKSFINSCVLSGSAISSIFHKEEPNDYDMYGMTDSDVIHMIAMIGITNQNQIEKSNTGQSYASLFDQNGKYSTDNAITFKNNVQFIKLSNFKDQRKQFDYIHCMPFYILKDDKLIITEQQWYAIKHKKLVLNPEFTGPPRDGKFIARGWTR